MHKPPQPATKLPVRAGSQPDACKPLASPATGPLTSSPERPPDQSSQGNGCSGGRAFSSPPGFVLAALYDATLQARAAGATTLEIISGLLSLAAFFVRTYWAAEAAERIWAEVTASVWDFTRAEFPPEDGGTE